MHGMMVCWQKEERTIEEDPAEESKEGLCRECFSGPRCQMSECPVWGALLSIFFIKNLPKISFFFTKSIQNCGSSNAAALVHDYLQAAAFIHGYLSVSLCSLA